MMLLMQPLFIDEFGGGLSSGLPRRVSTEVPDKDYIRNLHLQATSQYGSGYESDPETQYGNVPKSIGLHA